MNNNLEGFTLYPQPTLRAAGGVAFYANSSLDISVRSDLNHLDEDIETLWIEIHNKKAKNILCGNAYRHPSSNPTKFTEHIENTLHKISRENKSVFLSGDFNMNLLNFETRNETNEFLNTMNSHFMLPFVLQPTRITEHSATLIDYIFANVFCHNALSGNIVTKIADHLPQFLIAEDINLSYKSTEFYIHDFAQFNADNFFDDFSSLDWSFLEASNLDTNARFDRFLVHTSNCVNTHAPHRKLSKREVKLKAKPWLTKRILKNFNIVINSSLEF